MLLPLGYAVDIMYHNKLMYMPVMGHVWDEEILICSIPQGIFSGDNNTRS